MKFTNALKTLRKVAAEKGGVLTYDYSGAACDWAREHFGEYVGLPMCAYLKINGEIIDVMNNGGGANHVTSIRIRSERDRDDFHTDYCAGVFVSSLKSAFRIAKI